MFVTWYLSRPRGAIHDPRMRGMARKQVAWARARRRRRRRRRPACTDLRSPLQGALVIHWTRLMGLDPDRAPGCWEATPRIENMVNKKGALPTTTPTITMSKTADKAPGSTANRKDTASTPSPVMLIHKGRRQGPRLDIKLVLAAFVSAAELMATPNWDSTSWAECAVAQ